VTRSLDDTAAAAVRGIVLPVMAGLAAAWVLGVL